MTEPRPLEHLRAFAARYPNAWTLAADIRSRKGQDLSDWPDWCHMPLAASYSIISEAHGGGQVPLQYGADIAECAALSAWRATKGIYRFDAEIASALTSTPLTGHLPDDLLERLPEWCVYVDLSEAEYADKRLFGFYAHLERDANDGHKELRLLLDRSDGLLPVPLHLSGGNLAEAVEQMLAESDRQAIRRGLPPSDHLFELPQKVSQQIAPLVSLLLYLCSEQPEIDELGGAQRKPQNPIQIKTRNGLKEFPASTPTTWNVGWRIGAALRSAQKRTSETSGDGTHASPRVHIRRAHWHTFLTGVGRTRRELRWISPILVGGDAGEELPAVTHEGKR